MKILVVGSGGREHALVWKIAQSPKVTKIYCAPGNAGISEQATIVPIKANDLNSLLGTECIIEPISVKKRYVGFDKRP